MEYTPEEVQNIFNDMNLSYKRGQQLKHLLPTKKYNEVSFYEQDGETKFKVGDILMDGDGKSWLIIK